MSTREVTKSEFDAFLASYPNKLTTDICAICEPPIKSYNDFSLGKWPQSQVAHILMSEPIEPAEFFIDR
jgi:hypothetical protein